MQTMAVNAGQWYLLYITASKIMYVSPEQAATNRTINYPADATCAVFNTQQEANQYVVDNNLKTP